MELELVREYFPDGTNGSIFLDGVFICHTIELPWKDNQQRQSCIPEGCYRLAKRFSNRYRWHLLLEDVKDRALILMHAANDAAKELRGCIAPVTSLTGEGRGSSSKKALDKIKGFVYPELDRNIPVHIIIKSKSLKS